MSDAVPAGARIAVISKGDSELLRLDGHQAWHFPEGEDGTYAGHYPADSDACIAELERMRAKGAEHLVIPETARWWLLHYAQFGEHLHTRVWRDRGRAVGRDDRRVEVVDRKSEPGRTRTLT